MSILKKNIIANYASQLYSAGIGILILPLYIKYMGAEAYGLVGFLPCCRHGLSNVERDMAGDTASDKKINLLRSMLPQEIKC